MTQAINRNKRFPSLWQTIFNNFLAILQYHRVFLYIYNQLNMYHWLTNNDVNSGSNRSQWVVRWTDVRFIWDNLDGKSFFMVDKSAIAHAFSFIPKNIRGWVSWHIAENHNNTSTGYFDRFINSSNWRVYNIKTRINDRLVLPTA